MLIKKLVLHNFRQYIGTQEIEFSTDSERNVTVLIGVNTSGKTTLVRAFVLYPWRCLRQSFPNVCGIQRNVQCKQKYHLLSICLGSPSYKGLLNWWEILIPLLRWQVGPALEQAITVILKT